MEKIITKRPDDMSYEDYKVERNKSNRLIKHRLKGRLCWLSKLYPTNETINLISKGNFENKDSMFGLMIKGVSFVGNAKKDLKPL